MLGGSLQDAEAELVDGGSCAVLAGLLAAFCDLVVIGTLSNLRDVEVFDDELGAGGGDSLGEVAVEVEAGAQGLLSVAGALLVEVEPPASPGPREGEGVCVVGYSVIHPVPNELG